MAAGVTVTRYDPARRWHDPFRHVAPNIEQAHAVLLLAPAGANTPWIRFEIDLAERWGTPVRTWPRDESLAAIGRIVEQVRAEAGPRPPRSHDQRYRDLMQSFKGHVAAGDERAPQDMEFRKSEWMALAHHRTGGLESRFLGLALAAFWIFALSLAVALLGLLVLLVA